MLGMRATTAHWPWITPDFHRRFRVTNQDLLLLYDAELRLLSQSAHQLATRHFKVMECGGGFLPGPAFPAHLTFHP